MLVELRPKARQDLMFGALFYEKQRAELGAMFDVVVSDSEHRSTYARYVVAGQR